MKEKKLPYRVTFEHILPESRLVLEDLPLDPDEIDVAEAHRLLVQAGLDVAEWLGAHAAPLFVSALFVGLLDREGADMQLGALKQPPITANMGRVWTIMAELEAEKDGQA